MPLENISVQLKTILQVMLPIFITQVTIMGMSVADTVMSGHAGADSLAGVAIGGNIWMPVFTGLNGILMALTPIVAQLLGAQKRAAIAGSFWNGIYLAVGLGLGLILLGSLTLDVLLQHLQLTPAVHRIALNYLTGVAWGIVPFFINIILRSLVDTLGYPQLTMKLFLLTFPVNVFFNYLLIFGKGGFPALGGAGAGYGTSITYWLLMLAFILLIKKLPPLQALHLEQRQPLSWHLLKEHLHLGIPSGLAILLETSIWGIVGLCMAKFGTETIGAHETAISFEGLLYMLPLSFSLALTIIIGVEVGAKRYASAEQYARLGIGANLTLALVFVVILLAGGRYIALFYGAHGSMLDLTIRFLFYAAFFQLLDATATPIQGILRGYKDVKFGFLSSLIAYWGLCLPLGYFLDVGLGHGPYGYWQGLILGILISALLQAGRLYYVQKRYRISAKVQPK
ncbi:MAG: MATE family efflux transporter [Acidaminococcaceae bacterium]|jgi:MATE family multidrug resistance protein|nr:MATE family efflux transporter [Acidaminococcaceae bacterium]